MNRNKHKHQNPSPRRRLPGVALLALLLAGILFAFSLSVGVAQAQEDMTAETTVRLNFREGPTTDATIIRTFPVGTEVTLTGFRDATGNWVQVRAADGVVGWVSAQFLSDVPDDLELVSETVDTLTPSVTPADQAIGTDSAVLVPQVVAGQPGWIVIHRQQDGAPGAVIGQTAVNTGVNNDVVVTIDTDQVTERLYAMLHVDDGQMGVYEFPGADGPVTVDGNVVVDPFIVTDISDFVEGAFFPQDVVTSTTTVNLNLRRGPSLGDDLIETLPRGTVVGFTGFMDASGDWVQVDPVGAPVGWVAAQFLSNVPNNLNVPDSQTDQLTPSVSVRDQMIGANNAVTVPSVVADQAGWVVIHAEADGAPGPVIGQTHVDAGVNNNVVVPIDASMATNTVYAMLHVDDGQAGVYEFPGADVPVTVNDNVVVRPFQLDASEATFADTVVTATTIANLNLRRGPGLDYDIMRTLPAGSIVGFTGFTDATGNWVQVDPADGAVGWVDASFLSNVPDDLQVTEVSP